VCPFEWSTPFANGFERFTNKNLIKQMQLFNPMLINKKRQIIYLYVYLSLSRFIFQHVVLGTLCGWAERRYTCLQWPSAPVDALHIGAGRNLSPRHPDRRRCTPRRPSEAVFLLEHQSPGASSSQDRGMASGWLSYVRCPRPPGANRRPPHQSLPRWTAALCPRRPP
jgi:hypothetical protein